MFLISICYSLILIKLMCASDNNITQRPQVDGNTIIFDGPSWKKIDKEIFNIYQTCDTVIIRNTNISHFPSGLCKLKNLHTVECINNLELSVWKNLFTNLLTSRKKIKKLILNGNKQHCISANFSEFINIEELTIANSGKTVIQRLYSLNKCANLISLNLSNNKITEIPYKIHELKKLKHLNLSKNYIKELPADFYRLNTLEYLNLSENLLKEVKPEIATLSKLKSLNLSNNQLSDLPISFYSLSNLIKLNLSKNSLLTISPDIYKLHNLQCLNLGNNKLETLPIELYNLQKLEVLKLNQNLLSTIPSIVFLLNNLKELYVKNNEIKNILLDNETLDSVKQAAIEFSQHNTECSNNLSDALNLNTSTVFSNLSILDISYNHLTEIRSELSILKHLKILNASYNKISTFAVKLSDWPVLKHLNLCANKLTLAPYFENSYDVSNIELDLSKNSICDDNLNDCGYGLKQLQNFKFNRLHIYPQSIKQTYEDVIQEMNENTILWNLTGLNNFKISNADVYNTNIIITDYFMMKIWHSIIKWLVYDSNTNSDFEYNAAYITTEELAILFNKIIYSGIIDQLKQNPGYCGNTSITNKFSDRITNRIYLKNSIPNDLTSSVFLSYIKLMFKQVLEEIDEAGNNLEKITNLRNKVTELCSLCIDNTIEEAIEQLIHRYSLNYQFVYENIDAKFESFIYSRVNFYRESAFYETCKKFYHNNTEYHYILRSKFANQIGIYDDVNIIRKIDVMPKFDTNIFMKEFFNLFYFKNVQNSILLEIKGTIATDAFEFLKTNEKNNLNNHTDSSNNSLLHLTTQEIDKIVENKVINKYYTTTKINHDLVSFSLNSAGMIEILRILGFVYDSKNTIIK